VWNPNNDLMSIEAMQQENTMSENLSDSQRAQLAELDRALKGREYNAKSSYGHWGFRSVHDELRDVPVTISGFLPPDLEGVYIRNGTNPQFEPKNARYQMFDGPGMLHQIQISNGMATYSNAYVRTKRFEFEREAGREVYLTMGELLTGGEATLAKMAWLQEQYKAGALPELKFSGTGNGTAIQFHDGQLYAFNEAGYPFALSAWTDNGRLFVDGSGTFESWDGRLPGPFSAHPAIDPVTGDMYSVATNRFDGSITIAHVSKNRLVRSLTYQQPPKHMAWIHECCITENYIVFPDISMRFDRAGLRSEGGSMYYFDETYPMRFGVLPRNFDSNTDIRWIATDSPGVIWHLMNAWEEKQDDGSTHLVMFAPRYSDYPASVPIHTPEETHAHFSKWVIDLDAGKVLEDRVLLDWGYERLSFNVAYRGKPSRYCYLLDEQRDGYMGKGVLKYDCLEEREIQYVSYGEQYGGEPLFVPKVGATDEDDGYLMDLLMRENDAELLVLDAKSMTEVCRMKLPQRVPFGVHAVWLDAEKLAAL
jgi:carotenoid cleavage dioxygenase